MNNEMAMTAGILDFIVFLGIFYFLPTIICLFNGCKNKLAVILVNIFTGWTMIGWIAALILSLQTGDKTIIIEKQSNSSEYENKLLKEEIERLKNEKKKESDEELKRKYGPR